MLSITVSFQTEIVSGDTRTGVSEIASFLNMYLSIDQPARVSLATVAVVLLLAPEAATAMALVFHWRKLPGDDQRASKMGKFSRNVRAHG
jgi:hypothetical protein